MDPKTLQEIVLPLVAIALAICSLILIALIVLALRRERKRKDVALNIQRLGVSLKGDRVTALVVLFCIVALVPGAIWYVGQQRRLEEGREELKREQARATTAEQALDRFKFYELRVNPVFPELVDTRWLAKKVQVFISKPGEGAAQQANARSEVGPAGDLWVYLDRLNPGDKLRIAVEAGGHEWTSREIEIPRTQVQMFKK